MDFQVVFGKVIEGMDIVTEIGGYPMNTSISVAHVCAENTATTRDKPNVDVVIVDSGEVGRL
jgi:cyclophilin family peptidyl-prolyl cis-trans isomerase